MTYIERIIWFIKGILLTASFIFTFEIETRGKQNAGIILSMILVILNFIV